jgi:PKD repeat protein
LKNISTLVIVFVLICCSFSALAHITQDKSIQNNQTTKSSFAELGTITILDENFSDGSVPPSGWIHNITNPAGTWKIDSIRYHSSLYSAAVWRGPNCHGLMNEWLITPGLNFSQYLNPSHTNPISLKFWWYTDQYVVEHSLIYFNVSISTNGGEDWTKIWTAKNQSNFPQYQFTDVGIPIDISEYRNETNVTIGFQFYSNSESDADAQYFAIDDIKVLTESDVNFTCDAGGPYEWYFYRQFDDIPYGVRFHGTINDPNINPLSCSWLWTFGNGNTSKLPTYTFNPYNKTGYYNVTLEVVHGRNYTNDTAMVHIFLMAPPDINITLKKISFPGIQAEIKNPGDYNATNVNWTMKLILGPLKIRERIVASGTINKIDAHSTVQIKSGYFFGFKLIKVEITVTPENIYGIDKGFYAIRFGGVTIALPRIIIPE